MFAWARHAIKQALYVDWNYWAVYLLVQVFISLWVNYIVQALVSGEETLEMRSSSICVSNVSCSYSWKGMSWNSIIGRYMIFATDVDITRRALNQDDGVTFSMAVRFFFLSSDLFLHIVGKSPSSTSLNTPSPFLVLKVLGVLASYSGCIFSLLFSVDMKVWKREKLQFQALQNPDLHCLHQEIPELCVQLSWNFLLGMLDSLVTDTSQKPTDFLAWSPRTVSQANINEGLLKCWLWYWILFCFGSRSSFSVQVHPSGKNILGSHNVAFMHGPAHKAIRKSFLCLFTRKALSTYVELQDNIVRRTLSKWLENPNEREISYEIR